MELLKILTAAAALVMFAVSAQSAQIRVSQETSAGAGDFDSNIVGYIDAIVHASTIADFYAYGAPNAASYNSDSAHGGPADVPGNSLILFVAATDGLNLFHMHDGAGGDGGTVANTCTMSTAGAAFTVVDDGESSVIVVAGTSFKTSRGWVGCCTDGAAMGDVAGVETIYAEFDSFSSLNSWTALDGSSSIGLVFAADQRVRFDVPAPAGVLLLGAGLVVLGLRRKAA